LDVQRGLCASWEDSIRNQKPPWLCDCVCRGGLKPGVGGGGHLFVCSGSQIANLVAPTDR
jgi:hypothetical protein